MNSLKVAGKLKLAQHSTCGLKNAKQSRTMIFLSLIARVLQLQLRMSLACAARAYSWLIFNFFSTSTPRSFSAKLSSWFPALQSGLYLGTHSLKMQNFAFPFIWLMRFLSVHLSNMSKSLWTPALILPSTFTSLPVLHNLWTPSHHPDCMYYTYIYVLYLYICVIHTYCYNIGIYIFNILALVNSQQN